MDKAKENVEDKIRQRDYTPDTDSDLKKLIDKSLYTYYHRFQIENPRYGFILQNPGTLKNRHEIKDLDNTETLQERISIY